MTRISVLVTTMLLALGAVAHAQPIDPYGEPSDQVVAPGDVPPDVQTAVPSDAAPTYAPPPIQQAQPVPQGQWIYTQQYGWVWLPYGDQFVQATYDSGVAYAYVYYPAQGWVWLDAPWVIGWGPRPYFGHYGYAHYRWWPRHWVTYGGGYYGGGYYGGRVYDHRRPIYAAPRAVRPIYSAPRGWGGGSRDHRVYGGGGWRGGGAPVIRGGGGWRGGGGGGWHGGGRHR